MLKFIKKNNFYERKLYNKILTLSRDKLFFLNFDLSDTFHNRINLIFFHVSFIFIKFKKMSKNRDYDIFAQNLFNCIFGEIENNIRENGFGDATVNKNMKFLVKVFYNILIKCESFNKNAEKNKQIFLFKYLLLNKQSKNPMNLELVDYFNKYETFCFDLNPDSILKGKLNFIYKKAYNNGSTKT
jgi:hypothetical protein